MIEKLNGWKTVISIVVSMALKALVVSGKVSPNVASGIDSAHLTETAILVISGVADLAGIFFRLRATEPGALAPTKSKN